MKNIKDEISIIVLTFNEEKHIRRCISSLKKISNNIFIVDSFSKDNTVLIARELGAKVFKNPWVNYAKQFNWGIKNLPIDSKWIMRMDCDEYLTEELITEINDELLLYPDAISGLYMKRRVVFMDKWIKHGGYWTGRAKNLRHTERPQDQGYAPAGRKDQRTGTGIRGPERRRAYRKDGRVSHAHRWGREPRCALARGLCQLPRGGPPRAWTARLRCAADGRHLPASGQHFRDEDRRGQDPCGDLPLLSQCAFRQGRACGHRERLSCPARCRVDGQGLCRARHDHGRRLSATAGSREKDRLWR